MLNDLRNALINEYGNDDSDFIIGVPSLVQDNEDHIQEIIDYVKTEHPPKDQVVLYAVSLHRGYDF